jgi:uncharacterized protein (DUF58 family)
LRRLPIRLRRPLSGGADGVHASRQRGAGLSFVENRPYVPGDDVRAINWPLTARVGSPVVKRYEAGRELALWLLIDPSPSMFTGDPVAPLRWAVELAGAAMAALMAGGDRLGLVVPGDKGAPAIRIAPRRGWSACQGVLEAMAGLAPRTPSAQDWRDALGGWASAGRRQPVWLISDGGGILGLGLALKPIAARHRVVWFCPTSGGRQGHPTRWPGGDAPPGVEVQAWDMADDPVARLGQWLKTGA